MVLRFFSPLKTPSGKVLILFPSRYIAASLGIPAKEPGLSEVIPLFWRLQVLPLELKAFMRMQILAMAGELMKKAEDSGGHWRRSAGQGRRPQETVSGADGPGVPLPIS